MRDDEFERLYAAEAQGLFAFLTYRTGDMVVPRVDAAEPLSLELQDFAKAIQTGSQPRSNAQLGLQIVTVGDAVQYIKDNS